MPLIVRTADVADAEPMAALLNALIAQGGTTARRRPFDKKQIVEQLISPPYGINCAVAAAGSDVVGFQALEWADPDWPGPDKLPPDWAIIATYVALEHHGQGIGRKLFATTLAAARVASVRHIDATIRCENAGGLAYYDGMGFVDYRQGDGTISKRLELP
jgi:ribosomal protein S18 acetylase RimI-like enzyme